MLRVTEKEDPTISASRIVTFLPGSGHTRSISGVTETIRGTLFTATEYARL
jgi:hypothetical protein